MGHPQAATAKDIEGNHLGDSMAKLYQVLRAARTFPVVEDPALDGQYPKLWDLPSWNAILQDPDNTPHVRARTPTPRDEASRVL